MLEQKGDVAVWAMHRLAMSTPIEWSTFSTELKAKFIPSNGFDLVKRGWEQLSLKEGEHVTECNERFHHLHLKLDMHQPIPAEMFANAYGHKIQTGNQGVYKDLVHYIFMQDRTPTLEQRMQLNELDMSLNKSQPGSGPNTTTTTKASARKMDSKKGCTTGAVGAATDDGLTCYNCGQAGHIPRNWPKCDLMKKLLEQALVGNDAPKANSGHQRKDKKWGRALTCREQSGRHVEENKAKQETNSEVESELESLSDSDSEAGKGQGGL